MKNILFAFLLASVSLAGSAQGAVEKTIKTSCECFDGEQGPVTNYDEYIALVIKCVSPELLKNMDALKAETGVTTTDPERSMEQVAEVIGQRLVMECPKFGELTAKILVDDEDMKDAVQDRMDKKASSEADMIEAGKISQVSENFPLTLMIQTDGGESINMLILDKITLDVTYLQNPSKLKGKRVTLVYVMREIYDPAYKQFVQKRVVRELNVE